LALYVLHQARAAVPTPASVTPNVTRQPGEFINAWMDDRLRSTCPHNRLPRNDSGALGGASVHTSRLGSFLYALPCLRDYKSGARTGVRTRLAAHESQAGPNSPRLLSI